MAGLERLDCLVQNAGILTSRWEVVEGMESSVAVNVVGAVLLGLLVLPTLRRSAQRWGGRGRLVFVGSDLLYVAKFAERNAEGSLWEALNKREGADMDDRLVLEDIGVTKKTLGYCNMQWILTLLSAVQLQSL